MQCPLTLPLPRPRPAGQSYRQAAWVAHAAVERKQPALLKSFLRRKMSGEVDQEWGEQAVHGVEPEWLKVGGGGGGGCFGGVCRALERLASQGALLC
jgi:hypothetical protein